MPDGRDGRSVVLLAPGRLETRSGGYEYDRRIATGLRELGWHVEVVPLDPSFPNPTREALDAASARLAAIAADSLVMIDGLALGAMPREAGREAARLRLVGLIHLPLAAETGLDEEAAARFVASERQALAAVRLVVVTGRSVPPMLAAYGVAAARIVVVEPGTDPAPLARGSGGRPLQLFCAAAITPGKGHELLIRALAMTPHRDWRLSCAGSLDRAPATVERVRAALQREGLEKHVCLVGELGPEALGAWYERSDVFVLATEHETYCMAVAEALARGLPVVSTTTGAIPDLVGGDPPAGLLAAPGDLPGIADVLSSVLGDAELRVCLAEGARHARRRLPTWQAAALQMSAALERVPPRA